MNHENKPSSIESFKTDPISKIVIKNSIPALIAMGIFASKLDSSDLRSNWIEQLTNTFAQAAFFFGILLLSK